MSKLLDLLVLQSSEVEGIDLIYKSIDDLAFEGDFQKIDEILLDAISKVDTLSLVILYCLLTATLRFKDKLNHIRKLYLYTYEKDTTYEKRGIWGLE